jgi:DNA helicase-2/ATP-dependent DNA helicase PcrA
MLSDTSMKYPLTPEQESIANAPYTQPLMVLAPPGTGKTHTVVARILHLVEDQGLHPYELSVLCFSRAAVSEIMNRLRNLIQDAQVHDDLRFVSIRTFDSFATLLLLTSDPERNLSGTSYDQRIQMVVDTLLDPDSMESWIVSRYRHLIVDEVQDLVGVRARLVQIMLTRISGGFTLLGDPAQAIYGFAKGRDEQNLSSQELLEWVRRQEWIQGLLEKQLSENYRSTGKPAVLAQKARSIIQIEKNGDHSLMGMREILETLDGAGSAINPGEGIKKTPYDSVCILCRTNGEMLQLASLLSYRGIGYYIRPRPEDQGLPAWLGRVLGTYTDNHITLSEFKSRWCSLVGNTYQLEPDQAFRWLKRVEGRDTPDLEIRQLHLRLYRGARLPDEADAYLQPAVEKVSLSTIHAAKGREFEHVVVLKPCPQTSGDIDKAEEARVLYVAATRARKALSALDRDGLPAHIFTVACNNGRRRWIVALRQPGRYFMEIGRLGDVDILSPVSTWVHPDISSANKTQDFIWENILPGSLLYIYRTEGKRLFYRIRLHTSSGTDSPDLAQLSFSLTEDLKTVMNYLSRGRRFRYPVYWSTVRVAAVVTEILPPYPQNVHEPFSTSGFCLGLRLRGMANISLE